MRSSLEVPSSVLSVSPSSKFSASIQSARSIDQNGWEAVTPIGSASPAMCRLCTSPLLWANVPVTNRPEPGFISVASTEMTFASPQTLISGKSMAMVSPTHTDCPSILSRSRRSVIWQVELSSRVSSMLMLNAPFSINRCSSDSSTAVRGKRGAGSQKKNGQDFKRSLARFTGST